MNEKFAVGQSLYSILDCPCPTPPIYCSILIGQLNVYDTLTTNKYAVVYSARAIMISSTILTGQLNVYATLITNKEAVVYSARVIMISDRQCPQFNCTSDWC